MSEYYKRHRAILKLIIEAAMSQIGEDQTAFIQAPMIGAGCFLRAIKSETDIDVDEFLHMQYMALVSVLNSAPQNYTFTYKLCIYDTSEFNKDIIELYDCLLQGNHGTSGRFELGKGTIDGNVIGNVPFETENKKVFVVNPGDLRRIGNGMSNENSVEGYIVADAKGYNPQWQNTSFLHNPYFNPQLFDPVKSANSGNIVWRETMEW